MKTKFVQPLILSGVVAIMAGCASTADDSNSGSASGAASSSAELDAYRAELAAKEAEIERLRESAAAGGTSSSYSGGGSSDLFPPNAQPGHCYARVLIPAVFETESETVLKKEASARYETSPAQFETIEEQALVREASTRLEVIPATYKDVTEQVLIKPASTRLIQIPPEYETVSEQVLDKAAHTVWKRGAGPVDGALQTAVDQSTGEVVCLVEVPATYRTVTKTVLKTPGSTREEEIPAEYGTVTKTVVDTPPSTRTIEIPAEYKTVTKRKIVSPATQVKIDIPAEYDTVTKRKKVTEEVLSWREVLCKVNLTPSVIQDMQQALVQSGHLNGGADGILGSGTLRGVNSYARANNLPVGRNYIAVETAEALGINF